jgi:hypothetical protein
MPLALGLALAISAALGNSPSVAATTTPAIPPAAQTVREYVQSYWSDIPVMSAVAECESHYRQFNSDGDVFRGTQNHMDVGVMQINEHYHLDVSKQMGIDIYTLDGNLAYARYLYEQEGIAPWASSQPCWGKTAAAKKLLASSGK